MVYAPYVMMCMVHVSTSFHIVAILVGRPRAILFFGFDQPPTNGINGQMLYRWKAEYLYIQDLHAVLK